MAIWYCNYGNGTSTGYYAVAQWAATNSYSIGNIVRQLATPATGSERCFRCTTAGTSLGTEPTWVLTKGATTTESGGPVWTEVTGNSAYGWSACHARLQNATNSSWTAAGDTVYIASTSNETQSTAMVLTSSGTTLAPLQIICVNASGSVPPVAADVTTGAIVKNTGSNSITFQNVNYIVGINFVSGTNMLFPTGCILENCNVAIASSSIVNGGSTALELKDTIIYFGAATCSFGVNAGRVKWWGSNSVLTGTGPNNLITSFAQGSSLIFDGVDLSNVANTKNLCNTLTGIGATALLNECKLAAGVVVSGGSGAQSQGARIDLINCDSGATSYRQERYMTQGSMRNETTIVKTSPAGASDGTTALSWKVATTANNYFYQPFETFEIATWVDTANAHTATVEVLTDNVVLTNADVWAEVLYLGSAGNPEGSIATSRVDNILTTGSSLANSTATWTTTGLSTPKPQKIAVNFTTGMKGPIKLRVKVAKVSTTVYVDPYPTIT